MPGDVGDGLGVIERRRRFQLRDEQRVLVRRLQIGRHGHRAVRIVAAGAIDATGALGANLAHRTSSAASSADSQRGYMMPWAPASSSRPIRMNSPLAGRAMMSDVPTRAARISVAAVSSLVA